MNKIPISVLVHTLNEEANIRNCLECVKWADEIIIVDMYSDDRTVEIAKDYTDKIFFFERMGYADPARQFALEKASHEWILIVDADELISLDLKNHLISIMNDDDADVIFLPRKNYLFGHLMLGTNWGSLQDTLPRFFKKDFLEFSDNIHNFSTIKENSRVYHMEDPQIGILHFNYTDFEDFIVRMNNYTTIEAKSMYKNNEEFKTSKLIVIMVYEFYSRIIRFKGYKDGFIGYVLALTMAFYRLSIFMKLRLMKKYETLNVNGKIKEDYEDLAAQIISEYK
jgi:glycosyltransferase involved in cell wall biosynthesis